jgi:hypothetical protein
MKKLVLAILCAMCVVALASPSFAAWVFGGVATIQGQTSQASSTATGFMSQASSTSYGQQSYNLFNAVGATNGYAAGASTFGYGTVGTGTQGSAIQGGAVFGGGVIDLH